MNPPAQDGSHYWEVEVDVAPAAEELWSLFCYDRGAAGAQTVHEDAARCTVRYFFTTREPPPVGTWLEKFQAAYPGAPPPARLEVRGRATEDWQHGWRKHFHPTPVGQGLIVCPPWEVPPPAARAGRLPVVIEPGQGFGTGGHASTVLALELIEQCLTETPPPAAMLDVGIGSGILAIAARLLGLPEVWGLDVDGRVFAEVAQNFRLSGLAPAPRLVQGGPGCLTRAFPLVAANLTAPVLLEQREALLARTAPGGTLIASGILRREGEQVAEAYGGASTLVARVDKDDWCAYRLTRQT